jgi:hypothetical protein
MWQEKKREKENCMLLFFVCLMVFNNISVIIPSPTKLRRDIVTLLSVHPSFRNIRLNTRWILTKLGTYLVLKRIWNHIDFQGQRSRSPGQIFRRGDTPHFALPLLNGVLSRVMTFNLLDNINFQASWSPRLVTLVDYDYPV